MVERKLPKLDVAGSIPVSRSKVPAGRSSGTRVGSQGIPARGWGKHTVSASCSSIFVSWFCPAALKGPRPNEEQRIGLARNRADVCAPQMGAHQRRER